MEKTLEELKNEAAGLGIEFAKNIGAAKLAQKIEDFYESQAAGDLVEAQEDVVEEVDTSKKVSKVKSMADVAADIKKKSLKTRVVRITNNDKRDNHVTTTCYLSCENQYWGISKIVPLDLPVELEQCLIDTAKSVEVMLHVDEIIEGKRTGNKVQRMVKKYVISYEDVE